MPSFETALLIALAVPCVGYWLLVVGWKRVQQWRRRRRVDREMTRAYREIASAARFKARLKIADLQRAHLHAVVGQRRTQ